jgi:glutamate-1-semialdehyde 2,1-aminomutase
MRYDTQTSKAFFERAIQVLIEGGSSASRGPATFGDYPLFIDYGHGANLFDVDGNQYVDWMMAYGALPLGHAHPAVVEAIQKGAATGAHFAAATEIEIQVAELLHKIIPTAERVRFANTGTEAAMAALRLARGFTGKPKFIKFEGHYHGWYDDFLVNSNPQPMVSLGHPRDPVKIADSSGLNRFALRDSIVVPWNDLQAVERAIETHRGQVAAIFTEGVMANMGVIPPEPGFLKGLQELARANNILFVLDETVTGFRISLGGCQAYYDLQPDISTFGKAMGSGLPVAGFVGRADIMEALAWGGVLHYGTQNASRLGLHATLACLKVLMADQGAAIQYVWRIADLLCAGLRGIFDELCVPAIVQNVGPMLQVLFTDRPKIQDYREFCQYVDRAAYQRFVSSLFREGIYTTPSAVLHWIVTLAHTEEHVAQTLDAVRKVFRNASQ